MRVISYGAFEIIKNELEQIKSRQVQVSNITEELRIDKI